jgi:hypothetical protein
MRSFHATHNLFAVSAGNKETALNTEQTLDTSMLVDLASVIKYDVRRETNADEAIGKEEPDAVYDLGALASMDLTFSKGQAQHAAFIFAYALGGISTAVAGATGYKHTITPISGDLDASRSNPTFTMAMRYGKWLLKERYAGSMIDTATLSLKKDSWMVVSASVKSTGKRTTTMLKDELIAAYNATSLTLTDGIAGANNAQNRLDNVHHVRVQDPANNQWIDVTATAASNNANNCALTITPASNNGANANYVVLFNRDEAGNYAWGSFPARVTEPPLRVSDFSVNFGGKWDGSAIQGGHAMSAEISSLEWTINNALTPEFVPGGGTSAYANRALRDGRTQTLTLDRDFRDWIIGQKLDDPTDYFVLYAIAEGSEYEAGHNYTVEIIFPKVGIIADERGLEGKRLSERASFQILEDDTYGSVIINVKNKVATYAT